MNKKSAKLILLLGATGTIGRATADALATEGYEVVRVGRGQPKGGHLSTEYRTADVTNQWSLANNGFRSEHFDAVISCLASRTGTEQDAWAVDYGANSAALKVAQALGVRRFLLLSAICVQKPRLAFQMAKLAFEGELQNSSLDWTIVRPTAFFKSLSGQIDRVLKGKPFLLFGNGQLTACKPISDTDLAAFISRCVSDAATHGRIIPIGGPGPAITPLDQANELFRLLDRPPHLQRVPVALISAIANGLSFAGKFNKKAAAKAELARIGHFYATESMLVLDKMTGRYDADATPSFGTETLFDYYAAVIRGEIKVEHGDHSVF